MTTESGDTKTDDAQIKATLHRYLRAERASVVWKVTGLSARDARWPVTPTGTNLLGLVKHLACVEYGYFGDVFGRPPAEPTPWANDDDPTVDMWATADESVQSVLDFYARACAHADATIDALDLDSMGTVAWWGERGRDVTLHSILVHVIDETARHAGHADIIRELLDGEAGRREGSTNMPPPGAIDWPAYVDKLRRIAEQAQS